MILVAVLFSLAALLAVWSFLPESLDPAEGFGLAGVLGLGLLGLATWFVAWIAGPTAAWGGGVVALFAVGLRWKSIQPRLSSLRPATREWSQGFKLSLVIAGLFGFFGLVSALAPPSMSEWDTMAYHFAVPKLWLSQGNLNAIPFIHHSHFPYVVDSLFLLGLSLDSELAARAFTLLYFLFGAFAVFGFARRRAGASAGLWGLLGYLAIPVVLWEAGTGYVDGAHGLFVALAAPYALEWCVGESSVAPWVIGALAGCAAGSKFMGLLTVILLGLFVLAFGLRSKRGLVAAAWVFGLGFLIPAPWLVRNVIDTGNPVYPFFYSKFGGRGWDTWRATIYDGEQKSFGMGHSPTDLAGSVLGLGYGPGRFTNPFPTQGSGFPFQGIGAAGMIGGLAAWIMVGRRNKFVAGICLFLALNFGAWFFLSQQSRYVSGLAILLAILGAIAASRPGILVKAVVGIQVLITGVGHYLAVAQDELPAALGRISREDYLKTHVGFAGRAPQIATAVGKGKVALYDEVFGYFLPCDYMWGNPGHSMLIDHEGATDGASYVASLKQNHITHVYVNLQYSDKAFTEKWVAAMQGTPFSADEEKSMMGDLNLKWKLLVAKAAAAGLLKPVQQFNGALLFEVQA